MVCLLTTLHPERGLSRALLQHLAQEMSDIDFTMRPRRGVGVVWVCGYERGRPDLIERLRMNHPDALIVVTGRGPLVRWGPEVVDAGADHACGWPLPYSRLERLFRSARIRQPQA